jgi:hypothetical protein
MRVTSFIVPPLWRPNGKLAEIEQAEPPLEVNEGKTYVLHDRSLDCYSQSTDWFTAIRFAKALSTVRADATLSRTVPSRGLPSINGLLAQ